MAEPFVGEIRIFGGNFAPEGWLLCQGQSVSIALYSALFALIGTTYGGDGITTFALPDLRGRFPLHQGTSSASGSAYTRGTLAGAESVTLTTQQMPAHTHAIRATTAPGTPATTGTPSVSGGNQIFATTSSARYSDAALQPQVAMNPSGIMATGGGLPHENMPPFLALHFIIAVEGLYPSAG